MKIVLRTHLKLRLKQRKIPQAYPFKIITQPDKNYFDNITLHLISVKELKYGGKLRPIVVAYDIIDLEIQVITVYPTSEQVINNRINSNRWNKNEKN